MAASAPLCLPQFPQQDLSFPKQDETYVHRLLDEFCLLLEPPNMAVDLTGSAAILDVSNGLPDGGVRSIVTHVWVQCQTSRQNSIKLGVCFQQPFPTHSPSTIKRRGACEWPYYRYSGRGKVLISISWG
jgi:hypothetical protein